MSDEHVINGLKEEKFEAEQVLAQAIGGFPWYENDPENFPSATEESGVCVGDLTVPDLARMLAARYLTLHGAVRRWSRAHAKARSLESMEYTERPSGVELAYEELGASERAMRRLVGMEEG